MVDQKELSIQFEMINTTRYGSASLRENWPSEKKKKSFEVEVSNCRPLYSGSPKSKERVSSMSHLAGRFSRVNCGFWYHLLGNSTGVLMASRLEVLMQ